MIEETTGVGQSLRDARIRCGLTIDHLSYTTKISPTLLRAIEAEHFDRVPGGVFTRGFLRTFAREVGLDPEATVAQFVRASTPAESAGAEQLNAPAATPEVHADEAPDVDGDRSTDFVQLIAVAVIAIAAVAYLGMHSSSASPAETLSKAVVSERPVGTAGSTPSATGQSATGAALQIEVTATGPCWFSASADGTPVAARLMDTGDRETFSAYDDVQLRVGDPAAFSFTINGAAGRPVGDAGRAANLHITAQNFRQFLR